MPLNEEEQRILREIEQQFYESDPAFAREVGSTTVYRHAGRNLKWAALGFVVGVVVLVATLPISALLAFIGGFLVMLASAFWFVQNLRRLGRAGWQQVTRNVGSGGLRGQMFGAGQRMRGRFRRDDSA